MEEYYKYHITHSMCDTEIKEKIEIEITRDEEDK